MKIIIASDSYKGCMSSKEVATTMEKAIKDVDITINVEKIVTADGGEGFVEAMVEAAQGIIIQQETVNHLLSAKNSYYGVINEDTAVIDVASVVGLTEAKVYELTPEKGSSYGVGVLIAAAINEGYKKIIIGLGGSCTNDGGMGLLSALGVKFYDCLDRVLLPSADNLINVAKVDTSEMLSIKGIEIIVACDVKNRLLGKNGATYIFGPQKGISEEMLPVFEKGMVNYSERIKESVGVDLDSFVGGGAAGGMGSVLFGLLRAKMKMGIELLLETADFVSMLEDCDLVITGEGKTDAQTLQGKAVFGISKAAKEANVPVICISGSVIDGYQELYNHGIIGVYSISKEPSTDVDAIKNARKNLYDFTYSLTKTILNYYEKGEYK